MEIKTQNIKGGCCPACGANFGEKWGKRVQFNIRNIELHIMSRSGPQIIKMRLCKSHWPLETADYQKLLDTHKEYFDANNVDAQGQSILRTNEWQLDPEHYAA